jgi:hypothetical protein
MRDPRTDDRLEEFHLWAGMERPRISWTNIAVWGGLVLLTIAFWATIAWAIVSGWL